MSRRFIIVGIIVIELVVVVNCVSRIFSILRAQNRISEFKIQRDLLAGELAEKEAAFAFVRTDTYVEKIAREKLGYAREGDVVYVVPAGKEKTVSLPEITFVGETKKEFRFGQVGNWWKLFFK